MNHISVVGLGYVGLCTAVHLAIKGYKVKISSHSSSKVNLVNDGIPPFYEPRLKEMLFTVVSNKNLEAVLGTKKVIKNSDKTFITVGTPSLNNGKINLEYIKNAAKDIGATIKGSSHYHQIIIKSTVIPGTTKNIVGPIIEKGSHKKLGEDLGLIMSPEFLREGSAIYDVFNPDRVIIGQLDERAGSLFEDLCKTIYPTNTPILRTNLSTAEMIKYVNNAYLATKVSFINDVANICERIPGVDVVDVSKGIGMDSRINHRYLRVGVGWGGSCLPKDLKALIMFSKKIKHIPTLLESTIIVNQNQSKRIIEILKEEIGDLNDIKIAILGLSFKPQTDDMREAPSLNIIRYLMKEGAKINAYDPIAMKNGKDILGDKITFCETFSECLLEADCCIMVTEWDEFKKLTPEDFMSKMRTPLIIDGRRIFNPEKFSKGIKYRAIGLGKG